MKFSVRALVVLPFFCLPVAKADQVPQCLNISGNWRLESSYCTIPAWRPHLNAEIFVTQNQDLNVTQAGCDSFSVSAPSAANPSSRMVIPVSGFRRPLRGVRQSVTMSSGHIITESRDFDPAGIGILGPYPSNVYGYLAKYEVSADRSTLVAEVTRFDGRSLSPQPQCIFRRTQ